MGPGVVPNFVPFRQSPSRNFGMRNDVGNLHIHQERYFDVALLQNVKQPGGVTDTWPIVESHSNVWAVDVTGAISARCERAWS